MILQHIIYPKSDICEEELLYFHKQGAVYLSADSACLHLQKNGFASFLAYFNAFSTSKWARYTCVEHLRIRIRMSGAFRLCILHSTMEGAEACRILHTYTVQSMGESAVEYPLPPVDTGLLGFSLESLEDGGIFYEGAFAADAKAVRPVKLAAIICTYRREAYLQKTLSSISAYFFCEENRQMQKELEVFVIDNGNTHSPHAMPPGPIHLFLNKNTGGAGGFTRGILEATRQGNARGFTHVLLMDDDIVLEPEAIYRTIRLLSVLTEPYLQAFIGGAMLRLDQPAIQHAAGDVWLNPKSYSVKKGYDLREQNACLLNEVETHVDYNAWWYCVMPVSIAHAGNLPLPFFIRTDDVEYGLRSKAHIIYLNGVCVWHLPPAEKQHAYHDYYRHRNFLLCIALHRPAYPVRNVYVRTIYHVLRELCKGNAAHAHQCMLGVEHFYKGVDWFAAQDGEQLHRQILEMEKAMRQAHPLKTVFSMGVRLFLVGWKILFRHAKTTRTYAAHLPALMRADFWEPYLGLGDLP